MKKLKLLMGFLLLYSTGTSQTLNYLWAKSSGSSLGDVGRSLTTDGSGNVYVTGVFAGTMDFDPGPGVYNLTPVGNWDIFISKFDASGNFLWAKQFGGSTFYNQGGSITLDNAGNIYSTGYYQGTSDFDPGPGTFNLTSAGFADIYILKLDASGNFIWAKSVGSVNNSEEGMAITTDAAGNCYTTIRFNGVADFDPGAGTANLTPVGNDDNAILKLNASGNFVWVKQLSGANNEYASAIRVIAGGSIFIGGHFQGTADFDPGAGTTNLTSAGDYDFFLMKLNTAGDLVWVKQAGSTGRESAFSIAIDNNGNLFTSGYFSLTVDFDMGAGITNLTSNGLTDIFVLKTDTSGNFNWAKGVGGTFSDDGRSIKLDNSGNIFVGGSFGGTVDFDPGPGIANITASGTDIFVFKLNASGNYQSAVRMGGASTDNLYEIALDGSGNIFTTGGFSQTADFDPGPGSANLTSLGSFDFFIQKMRQCNASTFTINPAVCNNYTSPSGLHNWTVSGVYTDTIPNQQGCDSILTINLTINNIPVQPGPIIGNTTVCQGSTNTYSITPVSGATSYTWTLPAGWSGSSTTNSITATAGSTGGTISVTATNSCGTSPAQNLTVTVITVPPTPNTLSGIIPVCINTNTTYSVLPVPGATSYTWTLPPGWTGSSTTNSINVFVGSNGGLLTVTANNSCGSSLPFNTNISIQTVAGLPGPISGNITVCAGSSNTYSIAAVPGAGSYTWTLPAGWSGSSTTNSINTIAGPNGGTISVTANNSCGTSPAQTLNVTVITIPGQPGSISGDTTVCSGSSNTYGVTNDPSATSYSWTLPAGWSGSSTTNSISATAGSTGGTISVTANNSCGSSSAQTLNVMVITTPAQPGSISGDTTVCSGSSNTYSVTNDPSATSYGWTLPAGWSGSSTTNSISANAGASGGTISVIATNTCGSSSAQNINVSVITVPAQPGTISGNINVCQGSSNTYSIAAIAGATSYTWVLPAGWSGSSTTNSITTTAGAAGGTITVTANNSCGSSAAQSLAITVTSGVTAAFSFTTNLTTATFSDQTVGASSWLWDFGDGNTDTMQNPVHVYAVQGNYLVCLTVTNAGCTDSVCHSVNVSNVGIEMEESMNVEVYPNPANGIFWLETSETVQGQITDVQGRVILTAKFSPGKNLFDLSDQSDGVYFLNLKTRNFSRSIRLVKLGN